LALKDFKKVLELNDNVEHDRSLEPVLQVLCNWGEEHLRYIQ
jgi:DNA-binding HxlR family transcriptional regulator